MQVGLCEVNKDVRELVVVEKKKSKEVDCKDKEKTVERARRRALHHCTMLFLTKYLQE